MTKTATDELEKYLKTRNAWVTPDGQMRSTVNYDTSIMIFKNLTSRFDHVRNLKKTQKESLHNFKKG